MTLTVTHKKQRAFAKHTPKWQRFQTTLILPSDKSASQMGGVTKSSASLHPYQRQYSHVYHQRLAQLKPRCWEAVEALGDTEDIVKVERILDLREELRSILVGTVVKEGSGEEIHPKSRCQASQGVFIEDESGRVNLDVENVHDFCTGMILGLQGIVGKDGIMKVEKVIFPAFPPRSSIAADGSSSTANSSGESSVGPPHLLLVSGLNCGDPNMSPLQRDMLLSYVRGHFTNAAAKVAQVIVAGGCTPEGDALSLVGLKELDGFCLQVCAAGVPVDILPGKDDPNTANWPQRPLHGSMLKYTDRHASHMLSRSPNPYAAIHGSKYVLGTDGTNVTDLSLSLLAKDKNDAYAPVSNLESLRRTLLCGHICPTGPDTVPTMPHPEQDPMVIPEMPHVYFAGNCEQFATDLVETDSVKCRLLCVPKFSETGEAVLVNLETLQVELLRFEDPC